jgi:hypothetical protein
VVVTASASAAFAIARKNNMQAHNFVLLMAVSCFLMRIPTQYSAGHIAGKVLKRAGMKPEIAANRATDAALQA